MDRIDDLVKICVCITIRAVTKIVCLGGGRGHASIYQESLSLVDILIFYSIYHYIITLKYFQPNHF